MLEKIIILICVIMMFSCSSKESNFTEYKLTEINFEDFNYCVKTGDNYDFRIYDTIQNSNANQVLKDTTRVYFPSLMSQFDNENNISFSFTDLGIVRYIDWAKRIQIIAKELIKADSLFVLKDNDINNSIFIAKKSQNKKNEYFRTLSAYRIYYQEDGERKDSVAVIKDKILDLEYFKDNFPISDNSMNDIIIWTNIVYKFN